ncbi:MAG: ABC transporter permease [Bacteroidetes bacterium]|nr:ABC transporter permease [Bacteroidota bacterium]
MNKEVERIIKPPKGLHLNLSELWEYRELFYFFTWRDIKVKYKQTFLGVAWAVLQPLSLMVVFSFFFGRLLNVGSEGMPYPIFFYSGILLWTIFSTGFSGAGNSMVVHANMIKKIYFPRLIIPMSSILVALFDFLMAFVVYIGILVYYDYHVEISKMLVYLPLSVFLTLITCFGAGSMLAALVVKYRDFRYIITFLVQLLFFITPIVWPWSRIGAEWQQMVLSLNPMTGAINLARASLIDQPVNWEQIGISGGMAILLLFAGLLFFRKTESTFADVA